MSKDIWHKADETPKSWVSIAFYVDGFLYEGYYESEFNQYGIFGADKVEKWCYIKELSPYIPALETELERTRKALDVAVDVLKSAKTRFEFINNSKFANLNNVLQIQSQCEILKINEALEQITALEQKD